MSMKNCYDTIGNRTHDLPACSAVPQPTVPPCTPPGKRATEIQKMLKTTYVKETVTHILVFKWFKWFKRTWGLWSSSKELGGGIIFLKSRNSFKSSQTIDQIANWSWNWWSNWNLTNDLSNCSWTSGNEEYQREVQKQSQGQANSAMKFKHFLGESQHGGTAITYLLTWPHISWLFVFPKGEPVSKNHFRMLTTRKKEHGCWIKCSLFEQIWWPTSIHQPTNAHIISHKTLLKHFKTLQHVSILSSSSGSFVPC